MSRTTATYAPVASRSHKIQIERVGLDAVTIPELKGKLSEFIASGTAHQIVTVNLRFLSIAHHDQPFENVINEAALAVADGMPLLWLSRFIGTPVPQRITGTTLLHCAASLATEKGYGLFVLGSSPGIAEEAVRRLCSRYPGLRITGTHHGYFGTEEEDEVVSTIRQSKPDILFVAMGCPKQDVWIHDHLEALGVPVCAGIGGTLDVLVGRLKPAPMWMQRSGLEWFYRLAQEPRRLWRRYLLEDLPTAFRVGGSVLLGRSR